MFSFVIFLQMFTFAMLINAMWIKSVVITLKKGDVGIWHYFIRQ
ncbi:putative membrane protein [Bacteroides fragilis str. 3986T(B)10]|nr:putative membrane protein [Bacteroides fragilis str. 3986T(B)10]EXY99006.1 putative membrane protein [Bacteroides fragilis str. DS-166]